MKEFGRLKFVAADPSAEMLKIARACFINRFGLTTGTYV
jgi:hypothetical protein